MLTFQPNLHISRFMRYSRACGFYHDILDRWLLLTRTLLNHEFLVVKLKSSLRTFYGLLTVIEYLYHKRQRICSVHRNHNMVLSSVNTYHQVYNKSNTMSVTSGTGTAYPSGVPELIPSFVAGSLAQSLVLCVVLCRSLFVNFSFSFWPLSLYPSSSYGLYLALWYLQTFRMNIFIHSGDSEYYENVTNRLNTKNMTQKK
jgi:hypothetical protein